MNWLSLLLLPLGLQLIGYAVALSAVTGNGSFVGLLMIPVALASSGLLILLGVLACVRLRRNAQAPFGRPLGLQWLLALAPALLALGLRAVERTL